MENLLSIGNLTSWILLGVVTVIIYTLAFAPATTGAPNRRGANNNDRTGATLQPSQRQQAAVVVSHKTPCSRSPDHLVTKAYNNGSNVLNDGLIAFCHTQAAAVNSDALQQHRRRVQLLSRLVDASKMRPPSKGSTISVTVDGRHLECRHLQEAIQLFASYYNLLVIVATPTEGSNNTTSIRSKLVSSSSQQLLVPQHRILLASTIAGRVAIVRQLQRVELVLEIDTAAQELLARFGHKVIVYGKHNDQNSRFAQLWLDDPPS